MPTKTIADYPISIHIDGYTEPDYLASGIVALANWSNIDPVACPNSRP